MADGWCEELIEKAEGVCRNRLSIFDLENHDLGSGVDWNFEYSANKRTPMEFGPFIDYRDYSAVGDAKVVWELNRHQHLGVLGRAYRLTGDRRYAEKVVEHIDDWIRQCPFGGGINWRSPLELAIRLINWVWALELIAPYDARTGKHARRFVPVVFRHLWDISRRYSRYSSANNHVIGEAAGVFIGSSYFNSLKRAADWAAESRNILAREITRQTYGDGGSREQAVGYHMFVLEFFLLAGLAASKVGLSFPPEYWKRLERMFAFVAAFVEGGETIPMFGDCDDGYVLDLGGRDNRFRALLAVGAVLFKRYDFKVLSSGLGEPVFWLLGEAGCRAYHQLGATDKRSKVGWVGDGIVRSRALPDSGYYLLQTGHHDASDRISVAFDCGDMGLGPIAAHGHADALSFTLRVFGKEILVDPGTYDYFTWQRWRDYFRSTRAHNTITIDDHDQAEMLGSFLWGRRALARCLNWEPSPHGGTVTGEHDGYTRLSDPVVHRRTLTLDGRRSEVTVSDELAGTKRHNLATYFHWAEHCRVDEVGGNRYAVRYKGGVVTLQMDSRLKVSLFRGNEEPIAGWVSRGYHRKQSSVTLVGRCEWTGSLTLKSRIRVEVSQA